MAAREGRDLISRENVQTIVGTYSSACAMALQEIIHEHKVLHLAATSNSSKIVNENYTPYTYQFCPNSRMQSGSVAVALATLAKTRGWKTYVTIGQDYEWGRQTQAGFVEAFGQRADLLDRRRQHVDDGEIRHRIVDAVTDLAAGFGLL